MKSRRALLSCAMSGLALGGVASAAQIQVDSRQILLPIADVSADPAWSLYSGDESYARSLQDLSADLRSQDRLASAAFAAPGGNGDALTVRLKTGAPPQGTRSGDHIVHVWARAATPNGATFRVALLQGDDMLWFSNVWQATATFQEATMTVPQSAALAITDYQDLRLRFYAQGKPFFLTKAYMEAAEDEAPDLGYGDTPLWGESVNVVNYEMDPLGTGVSWVEDMGGGREGELDVYCSAVDQHTGRPVRVGDQRGVFMGRGIVEAVPQVGRRASGPFAVMLDDEGYIVTCDIDEADPALSVVTRWAGPDLDPAEDDPVSRDHRASIFATKDYTQDDRIVVYQYRDPDDAGGYELYLVDLDRDPLDHVRIWDPARAPPGTFDGIVLSTQRTLDATPYWFWGCFRSTEPGSPLGVCRIDLRDFPDLQVVPIIEAPETVLYGWPFVGSDGRQRWIAGHDLASGLRQYVEAEPHWVAEMDYTIDTDLWAPSFADPGRGQTPEVAGPDDQGRFFVAFSTHDRQDARGPFALGAYGKVVVAEIGRPDSGVVVSRKQNHQVQTEPEPFIRGGRLQVIYSETQAGPVKAPDEGIIQTRYIDLGDFPSN